MPDECLGTTAGVATQTAEVFHSIAVFNRTSLAYMSPSTYMYHRMVQVAFMNLRKLYRLHAGSGAGENDHLPLAPIFHAKIMHQCERVTVCTCASAACTDGGQEARLDEAADTAAPAADTGAVARQASGAVEAVLAQGLGDGTANAELAEADGQVEQEPWGFESAESSGAVQVDEDAGQHVGCGDEDVVGLAVNKADGLTVLRHMELLAQFNAWAAARSSRNDSVLDTSRIPRAQRKPVDELTHRPLSKAVRPVNKARILLLGSDCTRLRGEAWLTDEVMNSFAALINHRSRAAALGEGGLSPRRHSAPLRTFMFNTFFFSRLSARIGHVDYDGVRRWGVKLGLSLLAVDVILVPIVVQRTHWVLVTIDVVRRQFHYYDSLSAEDVRGVIPVLKEWLHDEVQVRLGNDAAAEWNVRVWHAVLAGNLPRQQDSGSCGVFVLAAADCFSLGAPLAFSQRDVAVLRCRIALPIFFDDLDYREHLPDPASVSGSTTPATSDAETVDVAEEDAKADEVDEEDAEDGGNDEVGGEKDDESGEGDEESGLEYGEEGAENDDTCHVMQESDASFEEHVGTVGAAVGTLENCVDVCMDEEESFEGDALGGGAPHDDTF